MRVVHSLAGYFQTWLVKGQTWAHSSISKDNEHFRQRKAGAWAQLSQSSRQQEGKSDENQEKKREDKIGKFKAMLITGYRLGVSFSISIFGFTFSYTVRKVHKVSIPQIHSSRMSSSRMGRWVPSFGFVCHPWQTGSVGCFTWKYR